MVRATWKIYAELNSVWTDITDDVKHDTNAEWGIDGNGPTDLVADTGSLEFDLDNYTLEGKYSPDHPNALTGWKKGVAVKQVFTYDGVEVTRFKGYVSVLANNGAKDELKHVTCFDWFDFAAEHPFDNPGIQTSKTADEILTTTLSLIPKQPEATRFDVGLSPFRAVFDTITSRTRAYTEMAKVALSEVGHVYLRAGETLVFENRHHRNGYSDLTNFPVGQTEAGFVVKAGGGGYVLKPDGGRIILNQVQTLHLDNSPSVLDYDITDGENVINRFTIYAFPRKLDASPQVLFELNEPFVIGSGETYELKGSYADPSSGFPINAQDMITPVATTDYLANVEEDGSGTNITSDLSIVDITFGTEGFTAHIYNGNGSPMWVTKFNPRGTGIYIYNPIQHTASNSDSIEEYGTQSLSMDQKYRSDLTVAKIVSETVVDEEKDPRTKLEKVYLTANKTTAMMMAFLYLDVGDMIRITNDRTNIDRYFYIQKVSYTTRPAGYITFSWLIKEVRTMGLGLDDIALEIVEDSGVNFGSLPHIQNLSERSFSVWIYITAAPVGTANHILAPFSDEAGALLLVTTSRQIQFYSKRFAVLGSWNTPVNSVPLNAWVHILVTYDGANATNDPVIFINGSIQTLTEISTPSGSHVSDYGVPLVIGNWKTATQDYNRALAGKIQDVQISSSIANDLKAVELYNGGTPDPSLHLDDLLFQAFAVKSELLADYINATLTADMKVRDALNGVIGTPVGGPVGRTP